MSKTKGTQQGPRNGVLELRPMESQLAGSAEKLMCPSGAGLARSELGGEGSRAAFVVVGSDRILF